MRDHRYHGFENHEDERLDETCYICNGGLAVCEVCKAGECELPEECPGRAMTAEERELICQGDLEFYLGCWWHKGEIVWTDKLGTKVAYR